ncbi:MAG TPA: hypothetical protein VKE40_09455, partial [Gemmataceae bacterium]|nr:hypothetical protein [Gemmataceae bacterium]
VAPSSDVPRFPLRMTEVTDGTSYTLGVIETGPPVPWSKPADIPYDTKKPLPPLTGPFANVRHAGTLDGVVHALRPRLDETTLRRLIEPNDGQVVPELKTLRARFAADSEEEKKALAQLLNENLGLIATLEQQAADHAALLGLVNKMTRDIDQAEEVQEQLKTAINALKAKNKKLRDEIGLRPGAPVPK